MSSTASTVATGEWPHTRIVIASAILAFAILYHIVRAVCACCCRNKNISKSSTRYRHYSVDSVGLEQSRSAWLALMALTALMCAHTVLVLPYMALHGDGE
jgi:hypothetical protein